MCPRCDGEDKKIINYPRHRATLLFPSTQERGRERGILSVLTKHTLKQTHTQRRTRGKCTFTPVTDCALHSLSLPASVRKRLGVMGVTRRVQVKSRHS